MYIDLAHVPTLVSMRGELGSCHLSGGLDVECVRVCSEVALEIHPAHVPTLVSVCGGQGFDT